MDAIITHECCAVPLKRGTTPDLVVIGAGSAGFSAAIRASELGARVALIGAGTIGGTCVNSGCVPSKTLIRAAEALHHGRTASRFAGIAASARLTDWAALMAQKEALVAGMREAKYAALLAEYEGIRYIESAARFTPEGLIAGDERFPAERVVIATGASPALPPIPGIDAVPYLTSTTALALARPPRSLLVIGGGVIGCELGQMFARFGVAVTIVCRSHLLPGFEPELVAALTEYLREEGIAIRCGVSYQHLRRGDAGVALDMTVEGRAEMIAAEQVLVATGRVPNTAGLALAAAGIATDAHGAIAVDDFLQTSRLGIYAAGDVTGRDQFVYMAAHGAKLAAENALGGNTSRYDSRAMPEVVFTDPQAARVGLSEAEARAQGLVVRTVTLPLVQVPRALAARDARGLIKLVADERSLRLLGAQILAPEGADAIQTAVLAIRHGLSVTDLTETLFPYLTTVEGVKLAALGFTKDVAKLSCCAG